MLIICKRSSLPCLQQTYYKFILCESQNTNHRFQPPTQGAMRLNLKLKNPKRYAISTDLYHGISQWTIVKCWDTQILVLVNLDLIKKLDKKKTPHVCEDSSLFTRISPHTVLKILFIILVIHTVEWLYHKN